MGSTAVSSPGRGAKRATQPRRALTIKMQLRPCRLEALSGSAGRARLRATIVSSGLVLVLHSAGVFAQARCPQPAARAASVEGRVEVRANPQAAWQPVRLDDALCAGDSVQVLERSRAGLLLANDVLLRLDQNSVLMLGEADPEKPSVMEFLRGWLHVITRHRKQFRVTTPVANAMVEGTEFTISAEPDRSSVTVDEGRVQMQSRGGTLALESGQAGEVRGTGAPQAFPRLRPLDAVQWALYFPPVLRYRPSLKDPVFSKLEEEASKLALEGDASGALERVGQIPPNIRTESLRTFEASLLLSVGRVDEAAAILKAQSASSDPDALALDAILQLIAGDRSQAAARAEAAVRARPTAAALLARSFVQQSQFKLEDALQSVKRATEVEPDNAIAWARLSELQLSIGEVGRAREAAERAVELSPRFGRGHTILGFVLLAQGEFEQAQQSFDKAVASLQGDPLPRLGKGLIFIRRGNLAEGRRELELAVLLDPGNSLLRSYLGKAYFDEERDELAGTQFDLARDLDPRDPTPWFYDAIRLQTLNRPGEALQELQESMARNENRAVYRSRLLLDQDLATRGTSLARIYDDLGFEELARAEASLSLSTDPTNYSAHRFLSDAYARIPRHEIARVSELLQAQLLQPINTSPVQPSSPVTDLNIVAGANMTRVSANEFGPLFERNGTRLLTSALLGNHGTLGDELILSGLRDEVSYSLGQFHYETDGYRTNNDLKHNIYNAFLQYAVTPSVNLQGEVRRRQTENGDIAQNFDPVNFSLRNRRTIEQDTYRLGGHLSPAPGSDFLVSVFHADRDESSFSVTPFGSANLEVTRNTEQSANVGEAQYLFRRQRFSLVSGIGAYKSKGETNTSAQLVPGPSFPQPPIPIDTSHRNAYAYADLEYPLSLIWTLGVDYDSLTDKTIDLSKRNWSPKAGLTWIPTKDLRVRLATFETIKRVLIANQTLQPTQIAGFNQFFDEANGTEARSRNLAFDARLAADAYVGASYSRRDLITPSALGGSVFNEDRDEESYLLYLYWTPQARWALSVSYEYDGFRRTPPTGVLPNRDPTALDTTTVPVTVRYFLPGGTFAQLTGSHISQKVARETAPAPGFGVGEESFSLIDAALGYRSPSRRFLFSLEGRNLTNRKFRFQDDGFRNSETTSSSVIPVRSVYLRATLNF